MQRGLLCLILGRSERPGEYVAPSWSWASVQGTATFYSAMDPDDDKCRKYDYSRTERADIVVNGNHPLGRANEISLWLADYLKKGIPLHDHEIDEVVRRHRDDNDSILDEENMLILGP